MKRIGRLDQPITIQELTTADDGMGATVDTYTALVNAPKWAEYIVVKGMERMYADKLESSVEMKLKIRRDTRVTSTCRVLHKGKTYRLFGNPDDYQRDNYMILRCQEIV